MDFESLNLEEIALNIDLLENLNKKLQMEKEKIEKRTIEIREFEEKLKNTINKDFKIKEGLSQEQKKLEKKIDRNEKVYRSIFEMTGVGIAEVSITGNFLMLNEPFCKITGYSEDELKSKNFAEITYLDDLEKDNENIKNLLAGKSKGYNVEKRYIKKDGSIVWVNLTVTLVLDKNNNPDYFVSVAHNINQKKHSELELEKQAKALYYSPVSIIITDKNGIIEYSNPAFFKITGFTNDEIIGQNPSFQSSGEMSKDFYKNLWKTILSGKVWRGIFINKKKNGEKYWEDAFISPIFNSQKEITYFVAVKEDITERKKAQEALIAAKLEAENANKVKSTFIANMSHEIRTPLNAILGFSKLLINDPQINGEQMNKLNIIKQNGEHLLNIINEILEISKIEAGKVSINLNSFDFHKFIYDLNNTFYLRANEKRINLKFVVKHDVPRFIITDEIKLRQILINLIGNALKFTDKGEIVITIAINTVNKKSFLHFSVKDTGIGIRKEDLHKIFENFVQVTSGNYPEGGTGLGLSITKEFINKLGGNIVVESTLGVGSDFSFYIEFKMPRDERSSKNHLNTTKVNIGNLNTTKDLQRLINLPQNTSNILKSALLDGDIEEIDKIISTISKDDAIIIKKLVEKFQYDKLLEML